MDIIVSECVFTTSINNKFIEDKYQFRWFENPVTAHEQSATASVLGSNASNIMHSKSYERVASKF